MLSLSRLEQQALAAFVARLRAGFADRLADVRLFGSRARGEGRADSDLDVMVQVRDLARQERRTVQDLAFDVGLDHGLVLSPLVVDPRTWRADLPLARAIEREGVPL